MLSKAGGSYRGVIIEQSPNGALRLLLPTGEVRTFEAAEVRWSGRYEDLPRVEPKSPPATSTSTSAPVPNQQRTKRRRDSALEVDLRSEDATGPVYFHLQDTSHSRTLCTPPCRAELRRGTVSLTLSQDGFNRVSAGSVELTGPSTLVGQFESKKKLRTIGTVAMLASPLGITLGLLFGPKTTRTCTTDGKPCEVRDNLDPGRVIAGAAVTTVLLGAGMFLVFQRDRASVRMVPGLSAPATDTKPSASPAMPSATSTVIGLAPMFSGDGLAGSMLTGQF